MTKREGEKIVLVWRKGDIGSLRTTSGVPSSGKQLRKASISIEEVTEGARWTVDPDGLGVCEKE